MPTLTKNKRHSVDSINTRVKVLKGQLNDLARVYETNLSKSGKNMWSESPYQITNQRAANQYLASLINTELNTIEKIEGQLREPTDVIKLMNKVLKADSVNTASEKLYRTISDGGQVLIRPEFKPSIYRSFFKTPFPLNKALREICQATKEYYKEYYSITTPPSSPPQPKKASKGSSQLPPRPAKPKKYRPESPSGARKSHKP